MKVISIIPSTINDMVEIIIEKDDKTFKRLIAPLDTIHVSMRTDWMKIQIEEMNLRKINIEDINTNI